MNDAAASAMALGRHTRRRTTPIRAAALPVTTGLLVVAVMASLALGPVPVPPGTVAATLWSFVTGGTVPDAGAAVVVLDVRLPRTLLAVLVGAALAVSGAVMQGLFRNPLADPGVVGVSSGAGFAAAAWFVFGAGIAAYLPWPLGAFGLPISAFAGALAVTLVLHALSRHDGRASVTTLILAGIAITALTSAGTGLLVYVSNDQQLREFTFWTLGSLAGGTWTKVLILLPFAGAFLILAPTLARGLDAVALGEAEAFHVGIDVEAMKGMAIVGIAAAVGASVALSGVIAFFGLAVPHLVRLAIGPSHRLLLIVSALFGGAMLVATDLVARTIASPAEIPLGVITAGAGAPFMLWLILARRRMLAL